MPIKYLFLFIVNSFLCLIKIIEAIMGLPEKIINTLLLLVVPIVEAIKEIWGIPLPNGLGEAIVSFLNLLLILFEGAFVLLVSVPAALKLRPKMVNKILTSSR